MNHKKANKFEGVLYDIRGRLLDEANRLELEGHKILKLNIGNTKPFGLDAPDEIITDVIRNIRSAEGYSDSKGIFSARKAIMHYCQTRFFTNLDIDNIFLGDGVSDLIGTSMEALLNRGDEILIPMPDYPLWTATVKFSGGKPVHYRCAEENGWLPDLEDIKKNITPKTKGIVIIPVNNPTGAVYPKTLLREIVKIAREHNLIIFSDEIYDKIIYDGVESVSIASMAVDVLFVTFNGLSKAYRLPGFRSGWMVISGDTKSAKDYIEGITRLRSMKLCSNVVGQLAIQTALGGYQSIFDLTKEGGPLRQQRDLSHDLLTRIPGISCVEPKGALYLFPKIDVEMFNITDDEKFLLDLLLKEHILLTRGKGFNVQDHAHFRIVFLPALEVLKEAIERLGNFLSTYKQQ